MAFSLLGFVAGLGIGRFSGLDDAQAARVAVLPGLLGISVPSLLVTGFVAQQQAASQEQPAPQNIVLPDVTYKAAGIAASRAALESLGLTVVEEIQDQPEIVPRDIVVAESPAAGTTVPAGSTVTLTKSSGADPRVTSSC